MEILNCMFIKKSKCKLTFKTLERPSFQQQLHELNLNKGESHRLRIPFSGSGPHRFNLSIDDARSGKIDEDDDDEDVNSDSSLEMISPGENDDFVILHVKSL